MSAKGAISSTLPPHVAAVLGDPAAPQADGAHPPAAGAGQPQKAGEDKVFECLYCKKTFGRLFVLKRHEKMHTRGISADPSAPTAGRRKKAKCACTNCQAAKQACDDQDTCEFCQKRGLVCERIPKPASTKRAHQPLVPHPPAERPPKVQTVRRKQLAPTITLPVSLKASTQAAEQALQPLAPHYDAGWASGGGDVAMECYDIDMSEASTVQRVSDGDALNSATSDTLTLHDGYLSDDYDECDSPGGMGVLVEDDGAGLGHEGAPYPGLTIRTTPDEDVLVDNMFRPSEASPTSSSPQTASPDGIFVVDGDEEMIDEFDEEEEAERLREQEQLLLIEQETMMRLSEQHRMNEQHQLQLQMMMGGGAPQGGAFPAGLR